MKIECNHAAQPHEERLEFYYSDWPEPADGSGIRGPAFYRRAVEAGLVPDPRKKSS